MIIERLVGMRKRVENAKKWGKDRASGDRPSTKIKVRTCSY